jgi:hypothetical protein
MKVERDHKGMRYTKKNGDPYQGAKQWLQADL